MTTPRMSERRTSVIAAFLVALGPVSMALYTPAMPQLVHAFSSTESAIKLTLSLYFAGFALAQLVSGTTSDVLGRRKTTLIFMSVYLVGSLMAAFAPSVGVLLAGRLVQGIGASVGMTVSRAIVRDQFTGTKAARIMNMVGMMLAIGPAVSPTLGGFALGLFGWQSIFFLMVGFALAACGAVYFCMSETTTPDPAKGHIGPILRGYGELATSSRFVSATLVMAGAVGALYGQATMLPFVLIDRVGLTPTQFGVGMLMQSGFFFAGTVAVRLLMRIRSRPARSGRSFLHRRRQHLHRARLASAGNTDLPQRHGSGRPLCLRHRLRHALYDDGRHGTLPAYRRLRLGCHGFHPDGLRLPRRPDRRRHRHAALRLRHDHPLDGPDGDPLLCLVSRGVQPRVTACNGTGGVASNTITGRDPASSLPSSSGSPRGSMHPHHSWYGSSGQARG